MVGSVQTLSSFCADDFTKAASGINTKILGLIEVDEHYIKNLTSVLREPLQTFCGDLMKEDLSTSVDKVDNFEVSTRSKLLSFVQTLLAANKANDSAMIQQYIAIYEGGDRCLRLFGKKIQFRNQYCTA
jgi:hypothetical protein